MRTDRMWREITGMDDGERVGTTKCGPRQRMMWAAAHPVPGSIFDASSRNHLSCFALLSPPWRQRFFVLMSYNTPHSLLDGRRALNWEKLLTRREFFAVQSSSTNSLMFLLAFLLSRGGLLVVQLLSINSLML